MATIVIVGGGFAGVAVARRLERRLRPGEAEIVLISRENYSLFTPMLPEVTSGELEVRHVVTPIRTQLNRTQFVLADVDEFDVERRTVTYHDVLTGEAHVQHYDELVLALGSSTSTFGLPGIAENTWTLKTLDDADALRNHLVMLLELADTIDDRAQREHLLTMVVVGGGFTGVETAGEVNEFFRSVLHLYKRLSFDEVKMVLVEAGPTLLAGLPPKMGEYSQRILQRRGVEVILGDGVARAEEHGLTLQSGRQIQSETIVWSAGVKPSPSIEKTSLPATKRGAVETGRDMRVVTDELDLGARRLRGDSRRPRRPLSDDGAARDPGGSLACRQHRRGAAREGTEAVQLSVARHDGGTRRTESGRAASRQLGDHRFPGVVFLADVLLASLAGARPEAARRLRLDARINLSPRYGRAALRRAGADERREEILHRS